MSRSKHVRRTVHSDNANGSRQYLEEISGQMEAHAVASVAIAHGEMISRTNLEDAARESTLHGHGTPEERFWQRQRGKEETITIGKSYISKVCVDHCD